MVEISLICSRLFRRNPRRLNLSRLYRYLLSFDLIAIGVGSTVGIGILLAGSIAKRDAGPAVVISLLIAAAASLLSSLCYAELGSRVPKAGASYFYTYVTLGEFVAFLNGWNLILEYTMRCALATTALTHHLNVICNHELTKFFNSIIPMMKYPLDFDPFAFVISITMTFMTAFGAKKSIMINNIRKSRNFKFDQN